MFCEFCAPWYYTPFYNSFCCPVICVLPFWHAHAWTHSVAWVSGSRCRSHGERWDKGPITDLYGLHKLKPCDMWKLQEVKGTPSLCSLLYQSKEKEKELAIDHEIMTVHFSMVMSPLGLAQCWAVSQWVSVRVWGKVNTHMADHVNQSSSQ